MTDTLRVKLLRLTNVRGIEGTIEIPVAEGMTWIEGENGTGKSSRVGAIAVLVDGDTTDLLHDGTDEAEIYLELTDGTWFRRVVTSAGRNELTAGHPTMGRIGKAKAHLTSLIASAALDPAKFLQANDAEAAEYVLKLAPLTVTAGEIKAAVGDAVDVSDVNTKGHALVVLDAVAKRLYDARTGENRTAKDARTTVEQLQGSLPEDVQDPAKVEAEIAEIMGRLQAVNEAQVQTADEAEAKIRQQHATAIDAVDARIADLTEQLNAAKAERREMASRLDADLKAAVSEAVAPLNEDYRALSEGLIGAREALKGATATAAAVQNTRRMIAAHEAKATEAHAQSQALTQAMAQVDALKSAKAADLPIKGISIRDGRLYIGERPASRANTAERVKIALQVCVRQDVPVKFISADSLESLDSKTRALLEANAQRAKIQILGARVEDRPELAIRAPEGAVA